MHEHRGRPVGSYLIAGFALWCATVVALVAVNAGATYRRERTTTVDALRLAADSAVYAADPVVDSTVATLEDLAGGADVRSLDPARCDAALEPLRSVTTTVHLHVVDATGREVCSLRAKGLSTAPLAAGGWLRRVLTGRSDVSGVFRDPILGEPAMRAAVPIDGPGVAEGAMVAVFATGRPAVTVPKAMPDSAVLLVVDPKTQMVVSRSAGAPLRLGGSVAGTPLARPVRAGEVVDLGGRRYVVETRMPSTGWRIVAALDESVALGPARRAVGRNVAVGLASLVLIGGLSLLIHRRLARPIRRIGAAIEASWRSDEVSLAPTDGPREVARVAAVYNELIVERAAREADLRHRAAHDVLTGLRNRAGIHDELEAAAAGGGAVLYLDLDRFKLVNDSYGHSVGDRVLRVLSKRLVDATGDQGVVARFGGDEFLITVAGAGAAADVASLAGRLCEELLRPVDLGELRLFLRGSIGIAHARDGVSPEMLVRDADTAMYRAKSSGGGWAVYDDRMGAAVRRRLEIESCLHGALEDGQLSVRYQPIVELGSGAVVGAEALLRWHHPELGNVSPGEFVPVAEETGLIVPIGAWVLDQAAAWAAARGVPVSVNVAAVQLTAGDLVPLVREALDRHGLRPDLLVLEVTESTVMDAAEATPVLTEIRSLGVGVALDDFGTGYSSLAYLERMPATELKIDRSFVSRLDQSSTRTIVTALVRLAQEMGLTVVAEGVETASQAEALLGASCSLAQGFLFSPAMSPAEFDAYSSSSGSTRSHRSPQSSHR